MENATYPDGYYILHITASCIKPWLSPVLAYEVRYLFHCPRSPLHLECHPRKWSNLTSNVRDRDSVRDYDVHDHVHLVLLDLLFPLHPTSNSPPTPRRGPGSRNSASGAKCCSRSHRTALRQRGGC